MEKIKETLDYINLKTNNFKPEFAIVLGSGLGCFCDDLEGIVIPYKEIPNFGSSNVLGHKGELLFTTINDKPCVIMQGRFHFYEGNSLQTSTYPIKIFKKMGVKTLFLTNAAGGISQDLKVGDIMLIEDHINFMGTNPLIGPNDDTLGERFPDMSNCYDIECRKLACECAENQNIELKKGIYLATTGPSYETAAEVRAFGILGANVVGMSTVPEAIVANYLKIKTIGFSIVTNQATGVSDSKLTHDEVLEIGKVSGVRLSNLIKDMISKI